MKKYLILIFIVCLWSSNIFAAIICPFKHERDRLVSISIFEGKGTREFSLAPEEVTKSKLLTQTWGLEADKYYWIECIYQNNFMINEKLQEGMKNCKISLRLNKKHNAEFISDLVCVK